LLRSTSGLDGMWLDQEPDPKGAAKRWVARADGREGPGKRDAM
jgi:hypothetical protein